MKDKAANAAVIRLLETAEESSQERLVKKHVPAWVVSGAIHVAIIALAILVFRNSNAETKPQEKVLEATAQKEPDPPENPLNDDQGVNAETEAAIPEIKRQEMVNQDAKEVPEETPGVPTPSEIPTPSTDAPAGLSREEFKNAAGVEGKAGDFRSGEMTGGGGSSFSPLAGRSGATKAINLQRGGGTTESERAVGLGLAWLARKQLADGSWEFDEGSHKHEKTCATGMALLPFLAAGVTHYKPTGSLGEFIDKKGYDKVVEKGLNYLKSKCPTAGANAGRLSGDVYANAIAALPLCEAFGMTKDPGLRSHAQAAVNFIQRTQGPNGSWGYGNSGNGDTSIVGWQIQVLKAAKLSKELTVSNAVLDKAKKFLDLAAAGSRKSMYGYNDNTGAQPGTALTAVGLLCRYYISEWGPLHPGLVDGVAGLMKTPPTPGRSVHNMYYYYYATQVVHFAEGEDWKTWNEGPLDKATNKRAGGMRDWLVKSQVRADKGGKKEDDGSWDKESPGIIGSNTGRLGTTCMCLLTLEVYYRHLPLYKRGADGKAIQIIE